MGEQCRLLCKFYDLFSWSRNSIYLFTKLLSNVSVVYHKQNKINYDTTLIRIGDVETATIQIWSPDGGLGIKKAVQFLSQ